MSSSGGASGGYELPVVAGMYYPFVAQYTNGNAVSANYGYATPLVVTRTHTFTGVGSNIASAASGGAPVLRFAIYDDDGSGYPGALVQDFGTVVATGTGVKVITGLSFTLDPGLYWVVVSPQGATTTQLTPRIPSVSLAPFSLTGTIGGNPVSCYTSSSTASFPTGSSMASTFPAAAILDNNAYAGVLS